MGATDSNTRKRGHSGGCSPLSYEPLHNLCRNDTEVCSHSYKLRGGLFDAVNREDVGCGPRRIGAMTTFTVRCIKGDFVVTGPDVPPMQFESRAAARDWCLTHHPGSPVTEIGRDASKRVTTGRPRKVAQIRRGRLARLALAGNHGPVSSAGLFCPYLSSVPSVSCGINLACRNIASSTCPVAAPTSSKPSAAASNNSAAFCQNCRAWAFSGRLSSIYTRASLSVRSAGPSLTWIERVSGADHLSRGISPILVEDVAPHSNLIAVGQAASLEMLLMLTIVAYETVGARFRKPTKLGQP